MERGPDARALADIEASFYKLVGGRRLGFLDPGFLRLIAHIALGAALFHAGIDRQAHNCRINVEALWQVCQRQYKSLHATHVVPARDSLPDMDTCMRLPCIMCLAIMWPAVRCEQRALLTPKP